MRTQKIFVVSIISVLIIVIGVAAVFIYFYYKWGQPPFSIKWAYDNQ